MTLKHHTTHQNDYFTQTYMGKKTHTHTHARQPTNQPTNQPPIVLGRNGFSRLGRAMRYTAPTREPPRTRYSSAAAAIPL